MRHDSCPAAWAAVCALATVILVTAGCETDRGGQPAALGSSDVVTVEVADRSRYDEVLAGLKGNVVLVDFWATWCTPCVHAFPSTVLLSRQYADSNLKVVSVSLDDPGDQSRVQAFLQSQGATFENLISAYGGSPTSADEFEIPSGAIPHYKLYDRTGQMRFQFTGHSEEIQQRVKQLLGEG